MRRNGVLTLKSLCAAAIVVIGSSSLSAADASSIKALETKAVIPTYLAGPPGKPYPKQVPFPAGLQSPKVRAADAHYLVGLGYLGIHDQEQAKAELNQAVEMSPDLVGGRSVLAPLR